MAIKKDGWFSRSFERFGVDQRMKFCGHDFNGLKSRGAQITGNPLCGLFNIRLMLAFCADAGDAKKFAEFSEVLVAAAFYVFSQVHWSLIAKIYSARLAKLQVERESKKKTSVQWLYCMTVKQAAQVLCKGGLSGGMSLD